MTQEDQILALFEQYFKTANQSEIQNDVDYINSLGAKGVSYEDYIEVLNKVTSLNLKETGLCDDIAYADLFNDLISPIKMDDLNSFTVINDSICIQFNKSHETSDWAFGLGNLGMAA
jgi:hypothetical protein